MAHQPALFKRIASVLETFRRSGQLSPQILHLVRLKIADVHQRAYCATVRTEAVETDVVPKEEAVFGEVDGDKLSTREALAVRLDEQLSRDPQKRTDEFFGELRGVYDDAALVELPLFVGLGIALDRIRVALTLDTIHESRYPSGLEYPIEDPNRESTNHRRGQSVRSI